MAKMKLNILPDEEEIKKSKRLKITNEHWDIDKIAKTFVKVGLSRDLNLLEPELIASRIGIGKDKIQQNIITKCQERIRKIVNGLLEELEDI